MEHDKYHVVITDCDHGSIEEEKEEFGRIGAKLLFAQVKREDELIQACTEADGLLNQYALLTRRVLEHLPRCKAVARYGVGVDSIDLKAATELGIIVANVPDYCAEEVATQTMALLLALARKTTFLDRKVKLNQWDLSLAKPLHRLSGRILGLIGYGRIGREVAKRAAIFGLRVIVFDPYIKKPEGIEMTNLDTLLKTSDFISVHCPLDEATRHLIGDKEFQKMEKKPFLMNTSRGPIVDEKALVQALERGLISGAGLDVLEKEPPAPGNPLLKMENVILTPHISFYSEESIKELKRRTAKAVSNVLTGKWPESLVNREVMGKTRAVISG
jgi:D-3-phosphoglycerate dehydrogenase